MKALLYDMLRSLLLDHQPGSLVHGLDLSPGYHPLCRQQDGEREEAKGGDFPGGTVVKKPPVNAGDTGSSSGPGRSHMPQSN